MSERPPAEANRELNEAEAAYFVEGLERVEPLLKAHRFLNENELPPGVMGDGSLFAIETKEAVFNLEDKWAEVERCAASHTTFEEGTESITWNLRIYTVMEAGERDAHALIKIDSFSVVKEGDRSGYATYEQQYMAASAETGLGVQVSPFDLPDELDEKLEAEDDAESRSRIFLEALDERETRRKNMEELPGIDDDRIFTPDLMYNAVKILGRLGLENRQDDPYL